MNQEPAAIIGNITLNLNFSLPTTDTSLQEAQEFGTFLVENREVFTTTDRTEFLAQYVGYRGALDFLQVHWEISDSLSLFCEYIKQREAASFHTFFLSQFLEVFRERHSVRRNRPSVETNPSAE